MRLLLTTFLLLFCVSVEAADRSAATAAKADVDTAYALCVDGDRLVIPAGDVEWPTGLTVTKAITVTGAGISYASGTVIRFGANVALFTFETASKINTNMQLSNIRFAPGTETAPSRWISINGCNTNQTFMIMTNLFFTGNTGLGVFVTGAIGVMSRCYWTMTNASIGCYIWHPNWNGASVSSGSFYPAATYGTRDAWIIEDCWAYRSGSTYAFTDAYQGARKVMRHSAFTNCWLELHGTESAFTRGTRSIESYFNYFYGDGASSYAHNLRSGTGIIFSNTVANVPSAANFAQLSAYRAVFQAIPFGQSHGGNPLDVNDATLYDSGTASSGGELSISDSTKNWTTNQWIGYSVLRTSPIASGTTTNTDYRGGYITANTKTNITVGANIGGAFTNIVFAAGNVYDIRKVTESFDQPGAGSDDVEFAYRLADSLSVTGNVATVTLSSHGFSTGDNIIIGELCVGATCDITVMAQIVVSNSTTFRFPLYLSDNVSHPVYRGMVAKVRNAQTLDPCYEWGNTVNGGAADFAEAETFIRVNEHFYNDTVKPGYTPLAYPHPLLGSSSSRVSGTMSGNSFFRGSGFMR